MNVRTYSLLLVVMCMLTTFSFDLVAMAPSDSMDTLRNMIHRRKEASPIDFQVDQDDYFLKQLELQLENKGWDVLQERETFITELKSPKESKSILKVNREQLSGYFLDACLENATGEDLINKRLKAIGNMKKRVQRKDPKKFQELKEEEERLNTQLEDYKNLQDTEDKEAFLNKLIALNMSDFKTEKARELLVDVSKGFDRSRNEQVSEFKEVEKEYKNARENLVSRAFLWLSVVGKFSTSFEESYKSLMENYQRTKDREGFDKEKFWKEEAALVRAFERSFFPMAGMLGMEIKESDSLELKLEKLGVLVGYMKEIGSGVKIGLDGQSFIAQPGISDIQWKQTIGLAMNWAKWSTFTLAVGWFEKSMPQLVVDPKMIVNEIRPILLEEKEQQEDLKKLADLSASKVVDSKLGANSQTKSGRLAWTKTGLTFDKNEGASTTEASLKVKLLTDTLRRNRMHGNFTIDVLLDSYARGLKPLSGEASFHYGATRQKASKMGAWRFQEGENEYAALLRCDGSKKAMIESKFQRDPSHLSHESRFIFDRQSALWRESFEIEGMSQVKIKDVSPDLNGEMVVLGLLRMIKEEGGLINGGLRDILEEEVANVQTFEDAFDVVVRHLNRELEDEDADMSLNHYAMALEKLYQATQQIGAIEIHLGSRGYLQKTIRMELSKLSSKDADSYVVDHLVFLEALGIEKKQLEEVLERITILDFNRMRSEGRLDELAESIVNIIENFIKNDATLDQSKLIYRTLSLRTGEKLTGIEAGFRKDSVYNLIIREEYQESVKLRGALAELKTNETMAEVRDVVELAIKQANFNVLQDYIEKKIDQHGLEYGMVRKRIMEGGVPQIREVYKKNGTIYENAVKKMIAHMMTAIVSSEKKMVLLGYKRDEKQEAVEGEVVFRNEQTGLYVVTKINPNRDREGLRSLKYHGHQAKSQMWDIGNGVMDVKTIVAKRNKQLEVVPSISLGDFLKAMERHPSERVKMGQVAKAIAKAIKEVVEGGYSIQEIDVLENIYLTTIPSETSSGDEIEAHIISSSLKERLADDNYEWSQQFIVREVRQNLQNLRLGDRQGFVAAFQAVRLSASDQGRKINVSSEDDVVKMAMTLGRVGEGGEVSSLIKTKMLKRINDKGVKKLKWYSISKTVDGKTDCGSYKVHDQGKEKKVSGNASQRTIIEVDSDSLVVGQDGRNALQRLKTIVMKLQGHVMKGSAVNDQADLTTKVSKDASGVTITANYGEGMLEQERSKRWCTTEDKEDLKELVKQVASQGDLASYDFSGLESLVSRNLVAVAKTEGGAQKLTLPIRAMKAEYGVNLGKNFNSVWLQAIESLSTSSHFLDNEEVGKDYFGLLGLESFSIESLESLSRELTDDNGKVLLETKETGETFLVDGAEEMIKRMIENEEEEVESVKRTNMLKVLLYLVKEIKKTREIKNRQALSRYYSHAAEDLDIGERGDLDRVWSEDGVFSLNNHQVLASEGPSQVDTVQYKDSRFDIEFGINRGDEKSEPLALLKVDIKPVVEDKIKKEVGLNVEKLIQRPDLQSTDPFILSQYEKLYQRCQKEEVSEDEFRSKYVEQKEQTVKERVGDFYEYLEDRLYEIQSNGPEYWKKLLLKPEEGMTAEDHQQINQVLGVLNAGVSKESVGEVLSLQNTFEKIGSWMDNLLVHVTQEEKQQRSAESQDPRRRLTVTFKDKWNVSEYKQSAGSRELVFQKMIASLFIQGGENYIVDGRGFSAERPIKELSIQDEGGKYSAQSFKEHMDALLEYEEDDIPDIAMDETEIENLVSQTESGKNTLLPGSSKRELWEKVDLQGVNVRKDLVQGQEKELLEAGVRKAIENLEGLVGVADEVKNQLQLIKGQLIDKIKNQECRLHFEGQERSKTPEIGLVKNRVSVTDQGDYDITFLISPIAKGILQDASRSDKMKGIYMLEFMSAANQLLFQEIQKNAFVWNQSPSTKSWLDRINAATEKFQEMKRAPFHLSGKDQAMVDAFVLYELNPMKTFQEMYPGEAHQLKENDLSVLYALKDPGALSTTVIEETKWTVGETVQFLKDFKEVADNASRLVDPFFVKMVEHGDPVTCQEVETLYTTTEVLFSA